jgi:YbbR domain-containing protein
VTDSLFAVLYRLFIKNWSLKLIAALSSLLLWVFLQGGKNLETTKEVPVIYKTSPGMVIANQVPNRVLFRLSGPKAFLKPLLEKEVQITKDLTGEKEGMSAIRFYWDSLDAPFGVRIQSVNPSAANVQLEKELVRTLPIQPTFIGTPPKGYRLGEVEVTPSEVTVRGPSSQVKALQGRLALKPLDLSKSRGTLEREIPLREMGPQVVAEIDGPPRLRIRIVEAK